MSHQAVQDPDGEKRSGVSRCGFNDLGGIGLPASGSHEDHLVAEVNHSLHKEAL
jgi:hypothetical protein